MLTYTYILGPHLSLLLNYFLGGVKGQTNQREINCSWEKKKTTNQNFSEKMLKIIVLLFLSHIIAPLQAEHLACVQRLQKRALKERESWRGNIHSINPNPYLHIHGDSKYSEAEEITRVWVATLALHTW